MNLRPVTPASAEPVSVDEARQQCKVDPTLDGNSPPTYSHPDDDLIQTLITAAREHVENFTNTTCTDATYEYRCAGFGGCIMLPRGPVDSVTSVKYLDENEQEQTLAEAVWYLDDNPWAPSIGLRKNQVWPVTYRRADAVRVVFSGGFNSPSTVPKALVLAMKLMIGHWYRNRENAVVGTIITEIPMGAQILMMPHRRGMGV
jgi:uncharacterized phiE125 gp8 family phage protein